MSYDRVSEFEAHSAKDPHKNANEQIGKALASIVGYLSKLTGIFDEITQILILNEKMNVRGVKQDVSSYNLYHQEKKSRTFFQKLANQTNKSWESVPYDQAVKNANFIGEVERKKAEYEQKISDGIARFKQLEQEKERIIKEWAATKDTLAAKKDHITSLLTELSETRQKYKEALANRSTDAPERNISESMSLGDSIANETSDGKYYQMKVIDENAIESNSLQVTKIDRERETAIKQHYQAKRTQLLAQMKIADEKAVKYYEEYKKILAELEHVSQENQTHKQLLEEAKTQQNSATSDLESTRRNYEDQMKLMTEHFMTLNDKVGKQEDTISRLNNHKVHCARCGTWNTVAWLNGPEGLNGRRCSKGNHPSSYNYS